MLVIETVESISMTKQNINGVCLALATNVPPLASCPCPDQLAGESVSDGFGLLDANTRLTSQAFEC